MTVLELSVVRDRIPGAAPVSRHSLFEAVWDAAEVEAEVVSPPDAVSARPRSTSLAGEWRRLVRSEAIGSPAQLPPPDSPEWKPVFVPDNWGTEPSLSDCFGPVYYQRDLVATNAARLRLVFDAVDYACDVWLDSARLGAHEGYFAPFAFDVTDRVRAGSVLTVAVRDPFEDLDPSQPFVLHPKRVIKGVLKYHDSRPGGLPGKHTPGWTPRLGQSMSTGGITGGVRLEGTGLVRIDAVFATTLDADAGDVHVAVVVTNTRSSAVETTLVLDVTPPDGELARGAVWLRVPPGSGRVDLRVHLAEPRKWWPCSHADLGRPELYRLEVAAVIDGQASDARLVHFGVRTAEVAGEPRSLRINGRPVFVRSVNFIPRQHFAGAEERHYAADLAQIAAANLNGIGVHAHVQPPACYEAADRAGMLVFQDFPLQWHYDSGAKTNPGFVDTAQRQIAEMAYLYWNHPSIVYWACHNEPTALFVPDMKPDPDRDADNQVLDAKLEERLTSIEPSRYVQRASGLDGDLHVYDGSLLGGAVYGIRDREAWFVSEYGFWTVGEGARSWGELGWPPDEAQLKRWLSRLSFAPATFCFSGLPERYPSFDAWREATESYGAFLAKYQTEWMRIRRGRPFNAYRWHFYCDWWGWAGGGLVDVDRRPKATYEALRLASRPLLVATSYPGTVVLPGERLELPMYAINDTREPADITLRWSFHHHPESLVIGADSEVPKRYDVTAPDEQAMVALPPGGMPPRGGFGPKREYGVLRGEVGPESTARLGTVRVTAPEEPFTGATLDFGWGDGEGNWFHVVTADEGWFCGPGAWLVSPSGKRRTG